MSFNEAVLNTWKMCNRDDIARSAMLSGMKPAYGILNRGLDPKSKKKRRFKNDGRAPDNNAMFFRGGKSKSPKKTVADSRTVADSVTLWYLKRMNSRTRVTMVAMFV